MKVKDYLKEKKEISYYVEQKEYVAGQVYCTIRSQHAWWYVGACVVIGLGLGIRQIWNHQAPASFMLAVVALLLMGVFMLSIRRMANRIYLEEPKRYDMRYGEQGFYLRIEKGMEQFYTWEMVKKEKRLGRLHVLIFDANFYIYVIIDC